MSLSALIVVLAGVVAPYGETPTLRYGEPAAAAGTFDAFTAAPPAAAPPAVAPPAAGSPAVVPVAQAADWNTQPPPGNPLRTDAAAPAGGSWNAPTYVADAAAAASAGPIQRLGTELQNAAAPIQEGFDQFGNRISAAADKLGARTDQLLDELDGQTRSLLGRGGAPPAASLPPQYGATAAAPDAAWNGGATSVGASAAPPSAGVGGSNWNQDGATPLPGHADAGVGWNQGATEAPPTGVAPGQFPPTNQGGPTAPPLVNGNSPQASFPQSPTPANGPPAPVTAVNTDRWSNSADPRFRTAAAPAGENVAGNSAAPFTGAGPILPPPPTAADAGASIGMPAATTSSAAGTANTAADAGRAIHGGMLNLPANRQLDDATANGSPASFPGPGPTSVPPPSNVPAMPPLPEPRATNAGGSPTSSYPNWNSTTNAAANQPAPAPSAEAAASSARDKAAVVLAWVLLFSSIAGNVYLFWSYLDVRTKYRSLVRKTARAVGSRFSAA